MTCRCLTRPALLLTALKASPALYEQRQRLERAKTGDLLKAKIQRRPDRQELVRQHILEDTGNVHPALVEKQRQLKKARLADALNVQLSHRPGVLELIKANILHTDEPVEKAVKGGRRRSHARRETRTRDGPRGETVVEGTEETVM